MELKNAGDGVYSHELLQQRFVFVTNGDILMRYPHDILCFFCRFEVFFKSVHVFMSFDIYAI